jgi:hypothetical protein
MNIVWNGFNTQEVIEFLGATDESGSYYDEKGRHCLEIIYPDNMSCVYYLGQFFVKC